MARQSPHSPEIVNGKVVSAVDWLGNRFAVGAKVVYCISAGRGQMMAIGEVLQIKSERRTWNDHEDCEPDDPDAEPHPYNQSRFFRRVARPYDDVTVQVKTLKTSGRWNSGERTKPAWVNPMNITALKSVGTA